MAAPKSKLNIGGSRAYNKRLAKKRLKGVFTRRTSKEEDDAMRRQLLKNEQDIGRETYRYGERRKGLSGSEMQALRKKQLGPGSMAEDVSEELDREKKKKKKARK